MNLQEFQKVQITRFKGTYARGATDLIPQDHGNCVLNMRLDRSGEAYTREGLALATNLTHQVQRMFLGTPAIGPYRLITYDGIQNLYEYNTATHEETILMTDEFLQDFSALNMFGRVYILPMGPPSNPMKLMVWDGVNPIRPALGLPPPAAFVAGTGPANVTDPIPGVTEIGDPGTIDAGLHRFAISYITDSGFETRPGPEPPGMGFQPVDWIAPGHTTVNLTSLPIGGPEVVAREIFVTKAGQEEFFRVAGGRIDDNTTTHIQLNFFDTDLAISADDLFDIRDTIDSAVGDIGGIFKYHGRMMVWGRPTPTSANDDMRPDFILVSNPGDPETFNEVYGWIQLPSEHDGNVMRAAWEIRDVLYLAKSVGIFSTQDNLDQPYTWPIVRVDGGCGTGFWAVSTITGSQTALSSGEQIIFVDRGGIYVFNGIVQQPQLTWKIKNIWDRVSHALVFRSMLCHDPFGQTIYALVPLYDRNNDIEWTLLVGDYSEGLTADNIKWNVWTVPHIPYTCISLMQYPDATDFDYHLRIGTPNLGGIFKFDMDFDFDYNTDGIYSRYEMFLAGFGNIGIFRALNLRIEGKPVVEVGLKTLDNLGFETVGNVGVTERSLMEYTRQINYTAEKMMVRLEGFTPWRVQRVDIYGKVQYMSRPLAS